MTLQSALMYVAVPVGVVAASYLYANTIKNALGKAVSRGIDMYVDMKHYIRKDDRPIQRSNTIRSIDAECPRILQQTEDYVYYEFRNGIYLSFNGLPTVRVLDVEPLRIESLKILPETPVNQAKVTILTKVIGACLGPYGLDTVPSITQLATLLPETLRGVDKIIVNMDNMVEHVLESVGQEKLTSTTIQHEQITQTTEPEPTPANVEPVQTTVGSSQA